METKFKKKSHFCKMKKIILGLIVVTAGLLLLGYNLGVLPLGSKEVIFTWPMILVSLGLIHLSARESRFQGLLLLGIGSFFMLPKIYSFGFNFIDVAWPVLIIFVGISIIFKKGFRKKKNLLGEDYKGETKSYEAGKIDENIVFGGSKIKFDEDVFKGGDINSVFGGTDIDFTGSTLPDGITELEINCIFGGVKITVPNDWAVQMKVISIMGGFHDHRRNFGKQPDNGSNKILIITGSTIFGGGEIKNS